jgi:hypothetical protein
VGRSANQCWSRKYGKHEHGRKREGKRGARSEAGSRDQKIIEIFHKFMDQFPTSQTLIVRLWKIGHRDRPSLNSYINLSIVWGLSKLTISLGKIERQPSLTVNHRSTGPVFLPFPFSFTLLRLFFPNRAIMSWSRSRSCHEKVNHMTNRNGLRFWEMSNNRSRYWESIWSVPQKRVLNRLREVRELMHPLLQRNFVGEKKSIVNIIICVVSLSCIPKCASEYDIE